MKAVRIHPWVVAAIFWALLAPNRAEASYLDPGSGSFVFQVALAMLLSAVCFLRGSLRAVIARLARMLHKRVPSGHR